MACYIFVNQGLLSGDGDGFVALYDALELLMYQISILKRVSSGTIDLIRSYTHDLTTTIVNFNGIFNKK